VVSIGNHLCHHDLRFRYVPLISVLDRDLAAIIRHYEYVGNTTMQDGRTYAIA
jgi:hypothetical protein